METITTLKTQGNDSFKAGLGISSKTNPRRQQHFINSCLKYAAALEAVVSAEFNTDDASSDLFSDLKPNLFLNLAMSNFQLDDFKESRRCCNAAIAFINNPSIPMNQLGEMHDINIDQVVNEPIVRMSYSLKSLCL